MRSILIPLLIGLLASFRSRAELQAEIAAPHHQLGALHRRSAVRSRLQPSDRVFWVWLSRLWSNWRRALVIIQPQTVLAWHRCGFRLYWRWKSRQRGPGRPKVSPEVRALIRKMSLSNPRWGAPRIHGELLKLGIEICETSVAHYMARRRRPPSQTWRTFLENHLHQLVAVDFFVVPTLTFRVLFVFVVLAHDRRRVLHCNVTAHPTAEWTAQQIREAFPWEAAPRFLLRDRDGIYGKAFRDCAAAMDIEEIRIAPRSPWQNPYVERLIGSIRRECLDHVIVFNERSLRRILTIVLRLPSALAHTPGAGQRRADHQESPASKTGSGDRDSGSGRTTPSLRAASSLRSASRDWERAPHARVDSCAGTHGSASVTTERS